MFKVILILLLANSVFASNSSNGNEVGNGGDAVKCSDSKVYKLYDYFENDALKKYKRDIPKGSEIIMSPITIKPILDVILDLGLIPIFCDLDLNTLCFSEKDLKKKINNKTKLIILTYLKRINTFPL